MKAILIDRCDKVEWKRRGKRGGEVWSIFKILKGCETVVYKLKGYKTAKVQPRVQLRGIKLEKYF